VSSRQSRYAAHADRAGAITQSRFQAMVGPRAKVTGAASRLITGTVVVHKTSAPYGAHTT